MIFLGMFYVIGFGILVDGLLDLRRSIQAGTWLTAPANLTQLELREQRSDNSTVYEIHVEYTYTVDGIDYKGDRVAFGYGGSSNKDYHNQIYQRLREAKIVCVRYDATKPSVSSLSYGVHLDIQIQLIFGVTWLLFVFGFSLLTWLSSRKNTVLLENLVLQ